MRINIEGPCVQGRNEVYGIRDQRQKMWWDQGSQARDLGSQVVGSGSVVLRRDQGSSFPTENQISYDKIHVNWTERAATVYKFKCIFEVTFCSGSKLYAIRSAGLT